MNPQLTPAASRKRLLVFFIIFLSSVVLLKGISVPSGAQSSEERELEDTIPKHLPIKVKIKKEKEKAFKDLKNEKWLRDFQLEVTNTGDKPIYLLHLLLTLPEITAPDGNKVGFLLHYGRSQLGNIETKSAPDDIPIKPGETYVFSFPEIKVVSWEQFKEREHKPDPKKLTLKFQLLSFGDGTGFVGNNGLAVPRPPNERSSLERCEPDPKLSDPGGVKGQHPSRRSWPAKIQIDDLPAESLLANFLPAELSHPASLKLNPQSQDCCPGNGCLRSKPYFAACYFTSLASRTFWSQNITAVTRTGIAITSTRIINISAQAVPHLHTDSPLRARALTGRLRTSVRSQAARERLRHLVEWSL